MAKQSKNLSLDPDAVRRGELFSELHETNVSQLVNSYLSSLPVGEELPAGRLSPAVRRLLGVAVGAGRKRADVEDYRRHLVEKYGR